MLHSPLVIGRAGVAIQGSQLIALASNQGVIILQPVIVQLRCAGTGAIGNNLSGILRRADTRNTTNILHTIRDDDRIESGRIPSTKRIKSYQRRRQGILFFIVLPAAETDTFNDLQFLQVIPTNYLTVLARVIEQRSQHAQFRACSGFSLKHNLV